MEKLAIISDIHGNLTALEAALNDIRTRDVQTIYCLGDLVGKGPEGAAVTDRCREVCAGIVKGNWDDYLARPHNSFSDASVWHREQLGAERLDYLAALPHTIDFLLSGRCVRLFHASAEGVYTRVHQNVPRTVQQGMFENTSFTGFEHAPPTVVGYGDIHDAYLTVFEGKTLFNAGSVGNPLDETTASYALLGGVPGSTEPGPFAVQIVRVPYDVEEAVEVATRMAMPDLEAYASELRTARYRGAS